MKKKTILIVLLSTLLISGCANSGHMNSRKNPIASLFNSSSENSLDSALTSTSSDNSSKLTYDHIDIDLTTMNATMVYSQVYDMLDKPSSYINKVIKVTGPFRPYESYDPDYCYPAIVVQDATACCANGLEFLLYDVPRCSMKGGNGYPLYNETATIIGRFETYIEDASLYVHLVDAIWVK